MGGWGGGGGRDAGQSRPTSGCRFIATAVALPLWFLCGVAAHYSFLEIVFGFRDDDEGAFDGGDDGRQGHEERRSHRKGRRQQQRWRRPRVLAPGFFGISRRTRDAFANGAVFGSPLPRCAPTVALLWGLHRVGDTIKRQRVDPLVTALGVMHVDLKPRFRYWAIADMAVKWYLRTPDLKSNSPETARDS